MLSQLRMETGVDSAVWSADTRVRAIPRRSRLARALEWGMPYLARARGEGYFARGVDGDVCRALRDGARRQTLYRFAPPPPLRLTANARRRDDGDEYAFRSPFVSHLRARNDASVRHHGGAQGRPLIVLNTVDSTLSGRFVERTFVAALVAAGADVAVPTVPGTGRRRAPEDRRHGWAHTVGAALSSIVQLVHDDVAIEAWARERGYATVVTTGLGMGGTVAAVLAATTTRFDAYVPVLAGAHPGRAWIPPRTLARAVHARALARAGLRCRRALARLFDPIAPLRLPAPRPAQRCMIVALRHDRIVPPPDVEDLADHWKRPVHWLPHGRNEIPRRARDLAALVVRAAFDGA